MDKSKGEPVIVVKGGNKEDKPADKESKPENTTNEPEAKKDTKEEPTTPGKPGSDRGKSAEKKKSEDRGKSSEKKAGSEKKDVLSFDKIRVSLFSYLHVIS